MNSKKQISIRIPIILLNELERYCDGVEFHNRNHAFTVILQQYLEKMHDSKKGQQLKITDLKPPKKGKK